MLTPIMPLFLPILGVENEGAVAIWAGILNGITSLVAALIWMVTVVRLHQPDFGIKPYSALLGTLKIKPEVTVRCSVPRASLPGR